MNIIVLETEYKSLRIRVYKNSNQTYSIMIYNKNNIRVFAIENVPFKEFHKKIQAAIEWI